MQPVVYMLVFGPMFYIGSTVNFKKRLNSHLSDLRRGRHGSKRVQAAFDLYGEPEASVVKEVSATCDLVEAEQATLNACAFDPNCLNVAFDVRLGGVKIASEALRKPVTVTYPDGRTLFFASVSSAAQFFGCGKQTVAHWLSGYRPGPRHSKYQGRYRGTVLEGALFSYSPSC